MSEQQINKEIVIAMAKAMRANDACKRLKDRESRINGKIDDLCGQAAEMDYARHLTAA